MVFGSHKTRMILPEDALAGRPGPLPGIPETHSVSGNRIQPPFPDGLAVAQFAMGCFWGAERMFWQLPGVWSTAVGYAGGYTPNPTYEEVCSGGTGHTEAVLVVFDPAQVSYADLLRTFWEGHDPSQGMRQGNDVGTQYRSAIHARDADQLAAAKSTRDLFQERLTAAGYGEITTEVIEAPEFFWAEDHHQQYLAKNPMGYCGIGGTGVTCPIGAALGTEAPDA